VFAFGLGHELPAEEEGEDADSAVDPEGAGASGGFDQQQEGEGDDEIEGRDASTLSSIPDGPYPAFRTPL
jgi:hypothetical protein